ncbi:MAG: phage holin family protein [Actinobacteria bacterium]|nr:phage holin family protein [Actinomycetota bacterium]
MGDLTPGGDTSLKALVAAAVADLQRLIRAQIQLAKLELQQTGRNAAKTSVFLAGALSMAATGGLFLLVSIAYVLVALGLPVWAGFGIVTLFLFVIAGVLGLLGRREAQRIKGPERTMAQIEKTKAMLSGGGAAAGDAVAAQAVAEVPAPPGT